VSDGGSEIAVSNLRPFFTFYGGKWRAAPFYAAPQHDHIVEPFAGSAGYAMRYPNKRVTLVERDPLIAATWRYLLAVTPTEVLALPDIRSDQTVDDLAVCPEARLLIGWWLNGGSARPWKSPSSWMRSMVANGGPGWTTGGGQLSWSQRVRERIAGQLGAIRHWTLIEGSYESAPAVEATWFIDPPYQVAGKHYRFGSEGIDYATLGAWCATRQGQVMVCENVGATWLPFRHWRDIKGSEAKHGGKVSREAIWTNGQDVSLATGTAQARRAGL
jgi:hypothetical protein